jgi:hypothetical protein
VAAKLLRRSDFIVAVTGAKLPVKIYGGDSVMSPTMFAEMGPDAVTASKALIGTQTALGEGSSHG